MTDSMGYALIVIALFGIFFGLVYVSLLDQEDDEEAGRHVEDTHHA